MSDEAPEGYRYEWVPDASWEIGGKGMKCRMKKCRNAAVAGFQRRHGRGAAWWRYCADHMYGRKIENGVVLHRILVKAEAS